MKFSDVLSGTRGPIKESVYDAPPKKLGASVKKLEKELKAVLKKYEKEWRGMAKELKMSYWEEFYEWTADFMSRSLEDVLHPRDRM